RADRGRYVAAALTVLRAYHAAGRPEQPDPVGSFEEWSGWVRAALLWLGEADPVETMEQARELDPRHAALQAVVTQWKEAIGGERVTVREIIGRATASQTGDWGRPEFLRPEFREALLSVAGKDGAIERVRLGHWLAANAGRVAGGARIVKDGLLSGHMTWRLVSMEKAAPRDA